MVPSVVHLLAGGRPALHLAASKEWAVRTTAGCDDFAGYDESQFYVVQ